MRSTTLGSVLLSTAVVFAFISILSSNLSWVVLTVAFASAYVYAYMRFVSELERTDMHIERKILDEAAYAMEPVSVAVDVLNKDPLPIRGTFEDVLPSDCILNSGSNKTTIMLPPRSVLKMSYTATPQKRGELTFPGMRIDRSDALGLFDEEQMIEHRSSLSVHTKKGSIDIARKLAGKEHLEFSGMGRKPAIVLREFEFDGIRDYVPGDRARDIHWKLLPKTGKLMTKTYRKEGAVHTTVFIDCGRSMRIGASKVAKIDHALDLSMQLSNVLLSSFHPVGVATFDEIDVIQKVSPALGRHQFERIVDLLKNVPSAVRGSKIDSSGKEENPTSIPPTVVRKNNRDENEAREFLSALSRLPKAGTRKRLGIGLEGGIKEILAKSRGQEQLFIVISDLVSTRDAVLAGAKICRSEGGRMLVINTYDDWYRNPESALDALKLERLYTSLEESVRLEAAFHGLGAKYLRIGPADSARRIVRAIRRGKA